MPKYRPQTTTDMDRRNAKIYEMSQKGIKHADIGRVFGIARQRVGQIVIRQEELHESIAETRLSHGDK
jgi:hypothetical protein